MAPRRKRMWATTSPFQPRHVFQEQADHPLALALRRGRVAPESREVRDQSHHLLPVLCAEHAAFAVAIAFVVLLGCGGARAAWCSTPPRGSRRPVGCRDRRGGSVAGQTTLRKGHDPPAGVASRTSSTPACKPARPTQAKEEDLACADLVDMASAADIRPPITSTSMLHRVKASGIARSSRHATIRTRCDEPCCQRPHEALRCVPLGVP